MKTCKAIFRVALCRLVSRPPWALLMGAMVLAAAPLPAPAQTFPVKPVRVVIPLGPGSGSDQIIRSMTDRMSAVLGQPVIVDYKPGGGTLIGAQFVKDQPADGHVVFFGTNSIAIKSAIPDASFDIRRDLEPVVAVNYAPLVIAVNAEQVKARTVTELIDAVRAAPGKLNYASYGIGSLAHLAMEILLAEARAEMVHVPFQNPAQAAFDTAAGRTQATLNILASLNPFVPEGGSGKLRLLGVTTAERMAVAPQLPGMREAGFPAIDLRTWSGFFVPKGTPRAAIDRLNQATNEALKDPKVVEVFARLGIVVAGGGGAEFGALVARDFTNYQRIIRSANLKIE